jgi:thiamine biosynthesis lipoprotein
MKKTRIIMGMPITVEVVDTIPSSAFEAVFDYFICIDERYSTYKPGSEISRVNRGLPRAEWSDEMNHVLQLCEDTKRETNGYFDAMRSDGVVDPSGLVKGWSIHNAANMLTRHGAENFYIEAGGDIQVHGCNEAGSAWSVGIRNPFDAAEIIKVVQLHNEGIATSGSYIRGAHIYNPHDNFKPAQAVQSLTVVGPNVYEADRFATAAYAMGTPGIAFIESLPGLEGYMVDSRKTATLTSGFGRYASK